MNRQVLQGKFYMWIMELFKIPNNIQNIVFHTDVLKGMKFALNSRDSFLEQHYQFLLSVGNGESLFFPSFNYTCLKTGKYEVQKDDVQVGILNEFIRKKDNIKRDQMPVFNFISNTSKKYINIKNNDIVDPFGDNSTFDFLSKNKSFLIHYGSSFNSSTIVHYVERISGKLTYRYDKDFLIDIIDNDVVKTVKFRYHVRPLHFNLDYNWLKLEEDLKCQNILWEFKSGRTQILGAEIEQLVKYWLEQLKEDPLYFLDTQTRLEVSKKLDELGSKFELKHFE